MYQVSSLFSKSVVRDEHLTSDLRLVNIWCLIQVFFSSSGWLWAYWLLISSNISSFQLSCTSLWERKQQWQVQDVLHYKRVMQRFSWVITCMGLGGRCTRMVRQEEEEVQVRRDSSSTTPRRVVVVEVKLSVVKVVVAAKTQHNKDT